MSKEPHAWRVSRRALGSAAVGMAALTMVRPSLAAQTDTEALVAAMTLREQVARMFMVAVSGTALTDEEDARLRALKPGGVILVGANFGTPDEVRALVASVHATNPELPPLVAVNQEGGIVTPIAGDPAPDALTLGMLPAVEIATLARARAELLASYGFDVNFAPVADIAFTPDSFMTGRVFGSDPERVADAVAAYVEGVAGTEVIHCVKHFPGHGRVLTDSHLGLPTLDVDDALWWEADALPFRVAVDAGVPMVMLGHLAVPGWDELPSSLSPETVRVLREDLGFDGVVVTDDLGMGALAAWVPFEVVDLVIAAGIDLLLFVIARVQPEELVDHLAARVEQGEVASERITESVTRLLRMTAG